MPVQVTCQECGARYSVKKSLCGKRLRCKCGQVLRIERASQTKPAEAEELIGAPIQARDGFLKAFDETTRPTRASKSSEAGVPSSATGKGQRFVLTTAIGAYMGMHLFILIVLGLLLILNSILLCFSVNALVGLCVSAIFAVVALIYAAIAVDANKLTVEIDQRQLSIRFSNRLPWPVRDHVFQLQEIGRVYVNTRMGFKSLFSSVHNNDDIEVRHLDRQVTRFVHVFDLVIEKKIDSSPLWVATFESQSTPSSIVDFISSRHC